MMQVTALKMEATYENKYHNNRMREKKKEIESGSKCYWNVNFKLNNPS